MSLTNIKKWQSERGFTIVELLIVIVIIGILAAIIIVAYNGITGRANTSAAQTAAENYEKKLDAYNAENSTYPTSAGQIVTAGTYNGVVTATTSSWYSASGSAFTPQAGALIPAGASKTTPPPTSAAKNVYYIPASTTYGSNGGGCIYYYDFGASAWAANTVGSTVASSCSTTSTTSVGTAIAV